MASELDLRELKSAIDKIFDHVIQDLKITNVAIPPEKDFYWALPLHSTYAVGETQPQLDVGRLTDDWEFLRALLTDDSQALSIMLMHVAPLLSFVGDTIRE